MGPAFEPIAEHIKKKMSDPSRSHFLKRDGRSTAAAPSSPFPADAVPQNLGQAIVMQAIADRSERRSNLPPANVDMSQGFGLTAPRRTR